MGAVYRAKDLKLGRDVAIKVLREEFSSDPERLRRFEQEARSASALNHPNIITIHDIGKHETTPYIAMEFVEGGTLREILSEGPLPSEKLLDIATQIADGLSKAHNAGIVHRDLKPENIMVTSDGFVKILDFGLAKLMPAALDGDSEMMTLAKRTQLGVVVGTVGYMSPEQASGKPVDYRSDQFAFGLILYEMVSGKMAFRRDTAAQTLAAIIEDEPQSLADSSPNLPHQLILIVNRCLEKASEDRYESTRDMARDLRLVPGELPRETSKFIREVEPAKAIEEARTEAARQRRFLTWRKVGLSFLVALGVSGVVTAGWLLYSGAAEEKIAELELQLQELSDQREYESAFILAAQGLPRVARFEELWNEFSAGVRLIRTAPRGAMVSRRPYDAADAWEPLGATPISDVRMPRGMSVVRFELEGREAVEMAILPGSSDTVDVHLSAQGEVPTGMVRVPAGRAAIPNYSEAEMELGAYLIDRYEVTNREFKEFVDAGGYDEPALWSDQMMKGSTRIEWAEAMAVFVDSSGLSGPATWEAGDYPDGADDLPVQGVSWWEARAYAAFRQKEIPTAFHWHRAAQVRFASYIVPMSHFGGAGPVARGVSHGFTGWGTYDMAGNVREWVANASGSERFILGGAWNDFTYLFPVAYATDPWDRSDKNGFRLASYLDRADLAEASQPLELGYRDYYAEEPVSDETFEAFRSNYAYDPAPLNATVSKRDVVKDWVVERVAFDTAYGDERILADLYLPREGRSPYQTVVLMPGSDAITTGQTLDDIREQFYLDFILKTGRAVILPAYDGAYERRRPDLVTSRAAETYAHAEYTAHWVMDLRRSVDYLESRQDIDQERIAFFGASWGGRVGAIMLAMEPRLRAGVLFLGGFRPERALPVADDLNFVSRVRQPVVMINGREDHLRPYEASQLPFFQLLGTAAERKEHRVFPGGHFVARADLIRETLRWLDRYLGPVEQ
jgi:dienelactone hydrolase